MNIYSFMFLRGLSMFIEFYTMKTRQQLVISYKISKTINLTKSSIYDIRKCFKNEDQFELLAWNGKFSTLSK